MNVSKLLSGTNRTGLHASYSSGLEGDQGATLGKPFFSARKVKQAELCLVSSKPTECIDRPRRVPVRVRAWGPQDGDVRVSLARSRSKRS